nr:nascent polypeptide-associated complex subunit alpha, muscle-specific form-like [Pan troglodytes]
MHSGDSRAARLAESPRRGPAAPSLPVPGEVLPARARSSSHPARPNGHRGPARGGGAGAVRGNAEACGSPIPSAAKPRASAAGSGNVTRAAAALPPPCQCPSPPASTSPAFSGRPHAPAAPSPTGSAREGPALLLPPGWCIPSCLLIHWGCPRKRTTTLFFPMPSLSTGHSICLLQKMQQQGIILEAETGPSPDTKPKDPFILDFQPPEL